MTDHIFQDLPWYRRHTLNHEPDEVITANNEGQPYLLRWHLIPKNKYFNIYLHRFVGPDQRMVHDHPWISLAYHLEGYFDETYYRPDLSMPDHNDFVFSARRINKGQWTYRNSKFMHYLIPGPNGAWTIFITGPVFKRWGFLTDQGWRHWKDVVANVPSNERRDY